MATSFDMGCTIPFHHSDEKIIAERVGPDGQTADKLILKHLYWQYYAIITPDGGQTILFGDNYRIFISDQNGKKSEMKFLRRGNELISGWYKYKALAATNLWVGVERYGDRYRNDSNGFTVFVTVFNDREMRCKHEIKTSDYVYNFNPERSLGFGPGNQTLIWRSEHDHFSYDVLRDELLWQSPAQPSGKK